MEDLTFEQRRYIIGFNLEGDTPRPVDNFIPNKETNLQVGDIVYIYNHNIANEAIISEKNVRGAWCKSYHNYGMSEYFVDWKNLFLKRKRTSVQQNQAILQIQLANIEAEIKLYTQIAQQT
jgi:hypothetical protein